MHVATAKKRRELATIISTLHVRLADGPDSDADPVGYALAQIEPLQAIKTSDVSLRSAIVGLASAYKTFYDDNGTKAVTALVTSAGDRVDKFRPGATS